MKNMNNFNVHKLWLENQVLIAVNCQHQNWAINLSHNV